MLSRRARKFLREKSLCEIQCFFAYRTRPFAFRMNERHVPFPSKFGGGLAASSRNSHIDCGRVCICCVVWTSGVDIEGRRPHLKQSNTPGNKQTLAEETESPRCLFADCSPGRSRSRSS